MSAIRQCRADERGEVLQIINSAAEAYRGVIPADRWHEPYMSEAGLDRVRPGLQQRGIGSELLAHLRGASARPMLVGTWADATWAIRFYQRHGFELVARSAVPSLLRTYWSIPDRQIEASVVLANPPLGDRAS